MFRCVLLKFSCWLLWIKTSRAGERAHSSTVGERRVQEPGVTVNQTRIYRHIKRGREEGRLSSELHAVILHYSWWECVQAGRQTAWWEPPQLRKSPDFWLIIGSSESSCTFLPSAFHFCTQRYITSHFTLSCFGGWFRVCVCVCVKSFEARFIMYFR